MEVRYKVPYKGGFVEVFASEDATKAEIVNKAKGQVEATKEMNAINQAQYEAGKGTIQRTAEKVIGETGTAVADTALTIGGSVLGMPGQAIRMMYEEKGKEVPGWVDWIDGYEPKTKEAQGWLTSFVESELGRNLEAIPPTMGGPARNLRNQVTKNIKKKNRKVPTKEELKARKNMLYKEAKDIGATFEGSAVNGMTKQMVSELKDLGYNAGDPGMAGITATIKQLDTLAKGKRGVDLRDLERIRKQAGNAASSMEPAIRMLGLEMIGKIDEFSSSIGAKQLKSGSKEAIAKITLARDAYKKFAKTNQWDMMYEIAQNKAGALQTARNPLEILRADVKNMFSSERGMKQLRFFSQSEREALKDFSMGGRADKLLQNVASLAPTRWSGGLSAAGSGGLGYMVGPAVGLDPSMAAAGSAITSAGLGLGAKALGNKRNMRKFDDIADSFATGQDVTKPVPISANELMTNNISKPMTDTIQNAITTTPRGLLNVWDQTALTPEEIEEYDIVNAGQAIPL